MVCLFTAYKFGQSNERKRIAALPVQRDTTYILAEPETVKVEVPVPLPSKPALMDSASLREVLAFAHRIALQRDSVESVIVNLLRDRQATLKIDSCASLEWALIDVKYMPRTAQFAYLDGVFAPRVREITNTIYVPSAKPSVWSDAFALTGAALLGYGLAKPAAPLAAIGGAVVGLKIYWTLK